MAVKFKNVKVKKQAPKKEKTTTRTLSKDIISGKVKWGSKDYFKKEAKQIGSSAATTTLFIAAASVLSHSIAAAVHHFDNKR